MVAAPLVAGSALALFFLIALRPLANYGVVVPLPAQLAFTVHSVPQELKHWLIIFHESPLPPLIIQGWINPERVSRVDPLRSQGQYTIQTMLDY